MNAVLVLLCVALAAGVYLYRKSFPVMTVNPKDKVILITGAAVGLGSDLAK
jgi:hypothetical protein